MGEQKQWLTPEQEKLRDRINGHPLLALPAEQRNELTPQRMDFVERVMALKKFDEKLEKRLKKSESALLEDERELREARTMRISRLATRYDSEAFLQSIWKALAGYDAAKGTTFLAYFDRIYAYEMHRAANREDAINDQSRVALSDREGCLLKEMQRLASALGYSLQELPRRYDAELAEALDITPEQLRDLMAKADAARRFVSMDALAEEEDGPGRQYADPHSGDAQARLECTAQLIEAVKRFSDLDCKEYPRLFFTNDALYPLKEEPPVIPADVYCGMLQRLEGDPWNRCFEHGYIEYTFTPPPSLDRLEHLVEARLCHPLQDASIAAYKGVSAPAVSYQRKRYAKALQAWLEQNGFDD